MDVNAGAGGLTAHLEALQCPPVIIVVVIADLSDTRDHISQVDDVGLPRCTDVAVADKPLRVVDGDDIVVETGAESHGFSGILTADDQIVETIDGTGRTAALATYGESAVARRYQEVYQSAITKNH